MLANGLRVEVFGFLLCFGIGKENGWIEVRKTYKGKVFFAKRSVVLPFSSSCIASFFMAGFFV